MSPNKSAFRYNGSA